MHVYKKDVLKFAANVEELLETLEQVLIPIYIAKLNCKLSKFFPFEGSNNY